MARRDLSRVEDLYHAALERPPGEREAFLAEVCGADAALLREVRSLLDCEQDARGLMEEPAAEAATRKLTHLRGKRLGRYEISELIGRGGMGEIYRARDTALGREVAIKVLPESVADDADRLRRFEQEARAAGALNHPNVLAVYDIGTDHGAPYLVTELLEGETLRERLRAGAMSIPEVIGCAVQVADGLAAAHHEGILHRDLKPENLLLTRDGRVKILDFGLAKLMPGAGDRRSSVSTEAKDLTRSGVLVGTVAYMSPEQAQGKDVDARSDVFSFGSVLYEMATGRRPFSQSSIGELVAAVQRDEPPRPGAVVSVPEPLEKIITRAMRKDPERRYQSMGDVRVELEDIRDGPGASANVATAASGMRWMALGLLAAGAAGLGWFLSRPNVAVSPMRIIPLTTAEGFERNPALSPDGEQVAYDYSPRAGAPRHIYVQSIATGSMLQLTEGDFQDHGPAWSPDGQQIAFLRDTEAGHDVLVVPSLGGPERKLTDSRVRDNPADLLQVGVSYSPDGALLAVVDSASDNEPPSLFLLSVESGEKRRLTFPQPIDERATYDRDPSFSPDGRTLAFIRAFLGTGGEGLAFIQSMDESDPRALARPAAGRSALWDLDWSADGSAVVISAGRTPAASHLERIPLDGGKPPELPRFDRAHHLSLARNGGRLVYSQWLQDLNIWRGTGPSSPKAVPPLRLLASTRQDQAADMSSDGTTIAFGSDRSGSREIWVANADGTNARRLTDLGHAIFPRFSPDGRTIVFSSVAHSPTSDVYLIDVEGGRPRNLTADVGGGALPSWSQDGEWLFYQSLRVGNVWQIWKRCREGGEPVQLTSSVGAKFAPQQSGAGPVLYQAYDGRIWSVPWDGGEEELVLDMPVQFAEWSVAGKHLAFINRETESIDVFDLTTGTVSQLASFDGEHLGPTLALSPDARWLLYTTDEHFGADLMRVEDFQ